MYSKNVNMKQFAQIMVRTHPMRFGERFWSTFDKVIKPNLPGEPVVFDLGTGPGLF